VGLYGYAAGTHVFVVDSLGLSTAIGSHFRPARAAELALPAERAGHEKQHRRLWDVARYASPEAADAPAVRDARRALGCGEVPELLDAVRGRFGPGRAWRNLRESLTLTRFRLPEGPEKAVRELCR
jgi:arabinofuranosyltransferase